MELTISKVTSGQTASSKNAQGSPAVKRLWDQDSRMPCPLGDVNPHKHRPGETLGPSTLLAEGHVEAAERYIWDTGHSGSSDPDAWRTHGQLCPAGHRCGPAHSPWSGGHRKKASATMCRHS